MGMWRLRKQFLKTARKETKRDLLWTVSVQCIHLPFYSDVYLCPQAILEYFQCVSFEDQTFPFPSLLLHCEATQ